MSALLYEINTRVLLRALSRRLGRAATLDDIEDESLERLAGRGFDWIWLLGVWRTGAEGRRIARALPELREAYRRALPDLTEEDVCGSCFAVAGYEVAPELGASISSAVAPLWQATVVCFTDETMPRLLIQPPVPFGTFHFRGTD